MKYCPTCKTDKDEAEFYREPKRPGRLSSECKECKRMRNRVVCKRWYAANSAKQIADVMRRRKQA